jgi:hypothetical protein
MIVRGFKSVLWVGAVGSAALSCYMVSLRVATERADLGRVEHQIVDTKRDIRSLQTELGTRGRLSQLEDWNTNVLALAAPSSSQFVKDGYTLAQLQTHGPTVGDRTSGDVRMASLETDGDATAAKADPAAAPKPAETAKPAKPAPAAPAPEAAPLPRIVQAVAPAPREATPVRRASFETSDAPATAKPAKAAPKPAKAHAAAPADDSSEAPARPAKKIARRDPAPAAAKKAQPAATADAAPAKKVKTAAKDGDAAAPAGHRPTRTAHADTKAQKKAVKAPGAAKLAGADAASHSSGHRGGAQ